MPEQEFCLMDETNTMTTDTIQLTTTPQSAKDFGLQQTLKMRGEIPQHVAIIMDGNGRWAKKQGWKRVLGHREGIKSVRDITEACAQLGVKYLTLYTFSTENWTRPVEEIQALMELLVRTIRGEVDRLHANKIRVKTIGNLQELPGQARREMQEAEEITAGNTRMTLTLALSYSGRQELVQAMQTMGQQIQSGKLKPEEITPEVIQAHLYTRDMPDPDLLIRTGGDWRISNYLLWQIAYTEIYVTDVLWPDFRRDALYVAMEDFQNRDRRFGGIKES